MIRTLKGLAEKLIVSHRENNSGGAVRRLNATPVLALDRDEHPYHIDDGAAAATYVDAFLDNINWTNVVRLHQAHAR